MIIQPLLNFINLWFNNALPSWKWIFKVHPFHHYSRLFMFLIRPSTSSPLNSSAHFVPRRPLPRPVRGTMLLLRSHRLLSSTSAFLSSYKAAIKTSRLAPLGLRAMAAYSAAAASPSRLLLRQLFEKESSTYTYLLADLAHPDKPAVVTPFLEPSLVLLWVCLIRFFIVSFGLSFHCLGDLDVYFGIVSSPFVRLCVNYSERVLQICVFHYHSHFKSSWLANTHISVKDFIFACDHSDQ